MMTQNIADDVQLLKKKTFFQPFIFRTPEGLSYFL